MRRLSFLISIFASFIALAQSPHGSKLQRDCSNCHQSTSWKIAQGEMTFRHSETPFELKGQHANVQCRQCHASLKFEEANASCNSCHKDVHANSTGSDCARCHTPQTWVVSNPNRLHQASRFPLQGNHAKAECSACHTGYATLNFKVIDVNCYSCHAADYSGAKNPNHVTAGFSRDCRTCHSPSSPGWRGTTFAHDFFPLQSGHKIENCFSCHRQGGFSGLNRECAACHQKHYAQTAAPNHTAIGFSTQCQTCHTIQGWQPSKFDHISTGFALSGRHAAVQCTGCHVNSAPHPSRECEACHRTAYNATTNPNHTAAQFPLTCATCHTTSGWQPAAFEHDAPHFPIYSGKHRNTWNNCATCHTNSANYKIFSCLGCHEHNQTVMQQEHSGIGGYQYESNACLACHPRGTKNGAFNHQSSAFPLTGAHTGAQCQGCHTGGFAQKPSTDCKSCHEVQRAVAVSPNHMNPTFPLNCQTCHTTTAWKPSGFNHQLNTHFQLTGKHLTAACNSCHQTLYTGSPKICKDCHNTQRSTATSPNHLNPSFPVNCEACHTTTAWKPSGFNHQLNTQFQLTGKHLTAACSSCHQTLYAGASKICKDCHNTDFQQAVNPNHQLANFTQPCSQCHTSIGWKPANYNHAVTGYTLQGKHAPVACNNCHTTQYANTTRECYGCHQTTFTAAVNPRHYLPAFAQACTTCHAAAISGWQGVSYTGHDASLFPIYSGKHRNQWAACVTCHETASNYKLFTCISCHEHNKTSMDNEHRGRAGYSYVSSECYRCHPRGSGLEAKGHNATLLPLTGAHLAVACDHCHTDQSRKPQANCSSCHRGDRMNVAHFRLTGTRECSDCHTTNPGWKPVTFAHAEYPLSARHKQLECADCHGQSGESLQCLTCHTEDFRSGHANRGQNMCYRCHSTFKFGGITSQQRKETRE